jgi:flagellar protein FliJ
MFNFDLQVLLEARQANEEKRQTALAEALRTLDLQRELLKDIKNKRLQMIREYYELEGKPVESLRLVLYSENIILYRNMEIAQEEQCLLFEREAEEKRVLLIEASKQKKMLEILKEKKFVAYQQALNAREGKELDEAAILRYEGGLS